MTSNSRLSFSALVLVVGMLGCSGERISDAPPEAEKAASPSATPIHPDVSTISLSELTILIDDHEFGASDGLGKLADYLGPPDRTSGKETEETWIWDRNGISASGTAESIDSFVVAFDPGGLRGSSPRGSFPGKVIVRGRGDLSDITINAGSDKELVSSARKLHRGFGSTHDAASGLLIDIQASFITTEESDKLNESPLLRSKYGDQQSHEPESEAEPDSTGKGSPPAE